ncbi:MULTISPECIES: hypothetical protein [Bacillaceae]|uniref:YfhE family protein n=1 Tax=Metabacillus sediminis TaxID=3117746 RepID=A0ABZ2ND97_9BACI|nr:hypothetical protein [Bacillus sp. SJS]
MGKTKPANSNAMANNNAKKKNGFEHEFASYAEAEAAKLDSSKKRD